MPIRPSPSISHSHSLSVPMTSVCVCVHIHVDLLWVFHTAPPLVPGFFHVWEGYLICNYIAPLFCSQPSNTPLYNRLHFLHPQMEGWIVPAFGMLLWTFTYKLLLESLPSAFQISSESQHLHDTISASTPLYGWDSVCLLHTSPAGLPWTVVQVSYCLTTGGNCWTFVCS